VRFHAAQASQRHLRISSIAILGLVLAIVIAGCGSSSKSTSSSTPAAAETTSSTASTPAATSSTSESSSSSSSGAGETLKLAADKEGQLKYDTTSLSAKAGPVVIDFANEAPLGHNVTVESSSGSSVGATPTFQGGSKTLKLNLKAGTYKFFCSVPGHRQAGMEGTITVK
jgi:plastocyanin